MNKNKVLTTIYIRHVWQYIKKEFTVLILRFLSLPYDIKNFSNNPKIFKATLKNLYLQLPFIH